MKSFYSFIFLLLLSFGASAANLTASSIPASFGKKDGKITLIISGGFAPYIVSWTGPSGYSSSKVSPDSLGAGTYCVTVTDQYCGVAKICVTVTEKTNSITELAESKTKIYPNPFEDEISIELEPGVSGNVQLSLFDLSGRLVASKSTEAKQKLEWKIGTNLPAGNYFIQVKGDNGIDIRKKISTLGNE